MTYICYQGNDHDCGFAALRMLFANKTKNKSYLYIRKPLRRKSFTFYDLNMIGKAYGFRLLAYQMPVEDVKSIPNNTLIQLKGNHAVYLKKVTRRKVIYVDPNVGMLKVSHSEFEKLWTGCLIECSNLKNAEKVKTKKKRISPIWMDVIHYALIAIIFAALMAGLYLINDNSSIILTMVFLALFAVTELVENWYILKELKYFDYQYLERFFSHKRNQNLKKYNSYMDYKKNYFLNSKLLVSSMILISAFSILLCLNDYRNVFAFMILLLVRVLDNTLFSKREKESVKEIEQIEESAFSNPKTIVKNLTKANNMAGKFGLNSSLKKVVYMFVSLCLALGMMLASEIVSTNFIIFHFGIYFLMSEAFERIIAFFSNFRDRQIKQARFLDDCDL